ncbi:hypothetical protein F4802DRAFT_603667 [Xylaria palmicola]|nr:hypothetical protein F4802DRAFT_603667 [Xylaria palmicola]
MSAFRRISLSSRLTHSVSVVSQLPIDENDFEDIELGKGNDVARLKTAPSQTYRGLIEEIVNEIKEAGPLDATFDYRWGVLRVRTGQLVSDDQSVIIIPLFKSESSSDTEVRSREVAFFTKDKIATISWQPPPDGQLLPMYLLPKGISIGVRTPSILFISIMFKQALLPG